MNLPRSLPGKPESTGLHVGHDLLLVCRNAGSATVGGNVDHYGEQSRVHLVGPLVLKLSCRSSHVHNVAKIRDVD